ncbi:carboxymuconolactone decarboxylase family protein [Aquimarina algiphila]|uniref:carboxymuconolactone decarboxylase family protein n=1 Tax=Aquimarina algiphila TaxID=2047982 RepID=UPI00249202AC|nr:carboxymuconolactone decarboxylase family protein [Aquimarina algiphila]
MNTLKTMTLEPKTIENADGVSSKILENTEKKLGFIPNMYLGMANNPALLDSYVAGYNSFRANSDFTPQEQEVVLLSVAFENGCEYCMAAHSFVGDHMTNVPAEVTNAIRDNAEIPDDKLKALSLFTKIVTSTRGLPLQTDIDSFLSAGYTEKHILGVITAVGIKTMSNYFNHIFNTVVDDVFKDRVWKKA